MTDLLYEELINMEFIEAKKIIESSSNKDSICRAVLAIGISSKEVNKAKCFLYSCFEINDIDISRTAILAIGHMARVNKNIDKNEFIRKINVLKFKNELMGVINDVLDDIEIFSNS